MVDDYLGALRELDEFKNGSPTDEIIHEITLRHSSNVRWDRELKNNRGGRNGFLQSFPTETFEKSAIDLS